jgi:hypothetical protein
MDALVTEEADIGIGWEISMVIVEARVQNPATAVGFVVEKVVLRHIFPMSVSFHYCTILISCNVWGWTVGMLTVTVSQ